MSINEPEFSASYARHVDAASMLPFLRVTELVLHLSAWGCVIAAIIFDGHADGWDPQGVVHEIKPYDWRHSTADAVVVAFLSAIIAGASSCSGTPCCGLAACLLTTAACVTKRAMLLERNGGLRSSCVIISAVACACFALASLNQALRLSRRRRRAREIHSSLLADAATDAAAAAAAADEAADDDDGRRALESIFPPGSRLATNHGTGGGGKNGKKPRGATLGRLLSLGRPERCMIVVATFALMGSTICQMTSKLVTAMSATSTSATAMSVTAWWA